MVGGILHDEGPVDVGVRVLEPCAMVVGLL